MDRAALEAILDADLGNEVGAREERFKTAILGARVKPEHRQRPSVECLLHHVLPRRFVVHTHAAAANWLACSKRGEKAARELFGEEVLWISYVDPGFTLARSIRQALRGDQARTGSECPRALIMQNHGSIFCGETPEEVRANTDWVITGVLEGVGPFPRSGLFGSVDRIDKEKSREIVNRIGPLLRGVLAEGDRLKIVKFDDSEIVLDFVGSEKGKSLAAAGPLTPDQIVYCRSFPLWLDLEDGEDPSVMPAKIRAALDDHVAMTGYRPLVVLIEGLGMFTAGDTCAEAETVRLSYKDAIRISAGAELLGGVQPLIPRDREFIETWEVEIYRRKVASASTRLGRMSGTVAVVTGAAQGFGKDIADSLAGEGAHVVLADINADGASRRAEELAAIHGSGRALGLVIDVTSDNSVADAMHRVVREYGGLDLLVSNAGVLRAGSVQNQPIREFELVTSVNYTGYFICVQNAAPIMALQHRAKPDYWGDIIQINSKSGLTGSNRNSAYAGSKFGGIGLTQSFALELIEEGIKVNAICPGNYFDGPLWSDPETGLFVQYLRTGKVAGAKAIEDVRRAYEAKIPMGRGCTAADVMKAIYYLVEQKYETGQALPVTGGQVMLR
jgi:NAD(P)-dependent dehydrogenase (short-subunit alcohol dehydrogenase family)/rhamnose utilization protein RhaD (predicted bifunctional aldolase and dehydrogenase)